MGLCSFLCGCSKPRQRFLCTGVGSEKVLIGSEHQSSLLPSASPTCCLLSFLSVIIIRPYSGQCSPTCKAPPHPGIQSFHLAPHWFPTSLPALCLTYLVTFNRNPSRKAARPLPPRASLSAAGTVLAPISSRAQCQSHPTSLFSLLTLRLL